MFFSAANDRTEQIKGAAMVPKRALDVMKGEINRMILLTKNCIIPTPYIVPRKVSEPMANILYYQNVCENLYVKLHIFQLSIVLFASQFFLTFKIFTKF